MNAVYDGAQTLAKLLAESEEYMQYKAARERAFENETTRGLLMDYHRQQLAAQAAAMAGTKDEESLQRLQKLGEILQMNPDASAYLMAEYRLSRMLGDVYKILGQAVDIDLGALEE